MCSDGCVRVGGAWLGAVVNDGLSNFGQNKSLHNYNFDLIFMVYSSNNTDFFGNAK